MTAAGQVRSEIVSRLKAAGLDAAEAYEDERFRERSGSVVAVGAKQAELAHAGLMNYLGELTTVRIVDDVIPALRASLRARFVRSKNTAQVRAAIRSQVMVELENKRAQEIIDSFGEVSVKASEDDPTVCLVEFSFAVAHGLNRIYLSAHITV